LDHRCQLLPINRLLADCSGNNDLSLVICGRLAVIALLKGFGAGLHHDTGIRVSEVALLFGLGFIYERFGSAAAASFAAIVPKLLRI
jgi:hypothetical protein